MQTIWLFQADPEYDLSIEIIKGRKDDWQLGQHRNNVSNDDTAILWQSGEVAGIYGFGKLKNKKGEDRIYIEYTERLETPLLRQDLLDDPVLCNALIIRQPFGKNPFRVAAVEWDALTKLLATPDHDAIDEIP